jgi:hypothetical protein
MEAENPKEERNAITARFSEGSTRWIPGDAGTRELRQKFFRIGTFVVGVVIGWLPVGCHCIPNE